MATVDIYAITDKLDDTLLKVLATRLEARGQHPRFQAMLTEYLDAMNIDVASTILDIGCGTGVAARAIARRKGFTGRVTGIDLSAGLVQIAERLSRTKGVIAAIWLRNSGVIKPSSSSPSVFTMPGLIALTRMPLGPSSNASVAVIASTAALLPPYTAEPAAG